jgi:hypothetical protein
MDPNRRHDMPIVIVGIAVASCVAIILSVKLFDGQVRDFIVSLLGTDR